YVLRNPPLRQAAKRCGEIALRDSFATTWRQPALPVAQSLPTVDFAQLAVWQNHSARKLRLRSVTSPSCRHVSHNLKKMKVKPLILLISIFTLTSFSINKKSFEGIITYKTEIRF